MTCSTDYISFLYRGCKLITIHFRLYEFYSTKEELQLALHPNGDNAGYQDGENCVKR